MWRIILLCQATFKLILGHSVFLLSNGASSCLESKKAIKDSIGKLFKTCKIMSMFLYILGCPTWTLFNLTIRPYRSPVWSALQPGLESDVQPVRAKVMGMKGKCCVSTLGWKTAYNENDDVTASMYFYFFQGKVDWTLTLFVTHFLTPFGDLNKRSLTYMWLPLKCMWFSVNDTLVLFVLASSLSAAFPPSFPTHSISLYVL